MSTPVVPAGATPEALLALLHAGGGGRVEGARAGSLDGAPDVSGLPDARGVAIIAAWSGARLHAGEPGAIAADDPDLALLAGDWCFSHALQELAQTGDLEAIGVLARAIGECALMAGEPAGIDRLAGVWDAASGELRSS